MGWFSVLIWRLFIFFAKKSIFSLVLTAKDDMRGDRVFLAMSFETCKRLCRRKQLDLWANLIVDFVAISCLFIF